MFRINRSQLTLVVLVATAMLGTTTASAQWSTLAKRRVQVRPVQASAASLPDDREIRITPKFRQTNLIGAWHIVVPDSDAPGFSAYQVFHFGGTMNETSDILGTLAEGPGSGVWNHDGTAYTFLFELYEFDGSGLPDARIRVRGTATLVDENHLEAMAIVDIIDLDGTVYPEVATTPFSGTRIGVD